MHSNLGNEDVSTLEVNLQSLLERAKSGTYRAPPVRRKHIPKGTGAETRPIGIPTFEDKVLQRSVVMLLEPIYEQDFHDGSYGFRPRRSPHDAMDVLRKEAMRIGGGWILEVDLRKFFDTLERIQVRCSVQGAMPTAAVGMFSRGKRCMATRAWPWHPLHSR
jgi:RNA-directed DNA polymerase